MSDIEFALRVSLRSNQPASENESSANKLHSIYTSLPKDNKITLESSTAHKTHSSEVMNIVMR